jgi:hypothetical protein
MYSDWFTPLHGKIVKRDLIAFDVEGCGNHGFVCGSVVSGAMVNFFTDLHEMWQTLLDYGSRGYWIFSHNLEYDLPVIADDRVAQMDMLFVDSGLLWGTYLYNGKKVKFYDSLNLFPRWSVAGLGAMVGMPKLSVSKEILFRLSKGEHYLNFDLFEQKEIERYCIRDAEILYKSLALIQDTVMDLGGNLRPTISGASMDVYRRRFHKWPWHTLGESTNKLARGAYYGGRVEPFQLGYIPNVSMYDTNSLYPYVQNNIKFPHPNSLQLLTLPPLHGDWWKWEGVCQAKVTVPQCYIPPLPYKHEGKLFFPYGTMDSIWTLWELRMALMAGAMLHGVSWVLGTPKTFNPFHEYIDTLYSLRSKYLHEGDPQANILKLLMNSLYGRFGLDPDKGLYRAVTLTGTSRDDELVGYKTYNLGNYVIAYGRIEGMNQPAYVNLLFAAQIASSARVHLYNSLVEQGEQSIYCDTDSIITQGSMDTKDQLGGWRQEFTGASVEIIAPKEYAISVPGQKPEYVVKGIPFYKNEEYIKNGAVNFMRAVSIREGFQQHKDPSTWIEVLHTRDFSIPKRRPVDDEFTFAERTTQTIPWNVNELELAVEMHRRRYYPNQIVWKPEFAPESPDESV